MPQLEQLDNYAGVMTKPYSLSRSRLGTTTKLFDKKFLCNEQGVYDLNESITEKLRQLSPSSGGFQYLLSFGDNTHFEHTNLTSLNGAVKNCGKTTNRAVLKWVIKHTIEEQDNELTVIVRVTNPINPLVFLQAALSKSPEDIDNLEFEGGSVSVSVDGAGQILSEEVFSVVGKWVDSRPQPQYVTTTHEIFNRHMKKFQFINYWLFPVLVSASLFMYLWKQTPQNIAIPVLFASVIIHTYSRSIASHINNLLERWAQTASLFSVFSLTGGDHNQQARFTAKSRNSVIKLMLVTTGSFALNIAASILAAHLFNA